MRAEDIAKLAQNYALEGMVWNVREKFAALEYKKPQALLICMGIVTEIWRHYEEGDVYEYSTGLGVCIARMGNVPDAMQFIYNKVLFEGVT